MEEIFLVYLLPFAPTIRHGRVVTNAAKATSGKSCECIRGSWMQGTVSKTARRVFRRSKFRLTTARHSQ